MTGPQNNRWRWQRHVENALPVRSPSHGLALADLVASGCAVIVRVNGTATLRSNAPQRSERQP